MYPIFGLQIALKTSQHIVRSLLTQKVIVSFHVRFGHTLSHSKEVLELIETKTSHPFVYSFNLMKISYTPEMRNYRTVVEIQKYIRVRFFNCFQLCARFWRLVICFTSFVHKSKHVCLYNSPDQDDCMFCPTNFVQSNAFFVQSYRWSA